MSWSTGRLKDALAIRVDGVGADSRIEVELTVDESRTTYDLAPLGAAYLGCQFLRIAHTLNPELPEAPPVTFVFNEDESVQ